MSNRSSVFSRRSRSSSARSETSNGASGGAPIRSRSSWTQRPNSCAPTLISAATVAIARPVSITKCAASRRYSGVYVFRFFEVPIKDILSGSPLTREPAKTVSGLRGQPHLQEAHARGRLAAELARLRRFSLIIVDEVGYLPFEQDAANLFFQLVSSRYEHASLILTSNLPFSGWSGVFGDQVVAAAMIDRIVHHADVIALKGASYRLRDRGIDTLPSIRAEQH